MDALKVAGLAAGVGAVVYVLTRPAWRVVERASFVNWGVVLPDMAARLASDPFRPDVVIKVEPRRGGGETRLVRVRVMSALGAGRMRGVVVDVERPAAWTPSKDDAVTFSELEVVGLA